MNRCEVSLIRTPISIVERKGGKVFGYVLSRGRKKETRKHIYWSMNFGVVICAMCPLTIELIPFLFFFFSTSWNFSFIGQASHVDRSRVS